MVTDRRKSEIVLQEQCEHIVCLQTLNSIIEERWALEGRRRCAGRTLKLKDSLSSKSNLQLLSASANSIGVQCTQAISSVIPPKMQIILKCVYAENRHHC